jgi:hypothetical protein
MFALHGPAVPPLQQRAAQGRPALALG